MMEGGGIRVPIKTIAKVDLKKYIQHQGVDLFWGDLIDYVQDSLFIKSDKDGTFNEKKFISKVYQLGISVRNYKYIKSRDPEIVIERFTKTRKRTVPGIADPVYSSSNYKHTFPYDDYIPKPAEIEIITKSVGEEATPIDTLPKEKLPIDISVPIEKDPKIKITPDPPAPIGKENMILRPMIIPITSESDYYRIYAENYFSATSPPKVSGCKNNFYTKSKKTHEISDDGGSIGKIIPTLQKGTCYCRISIRLSDGLGGYLYSKPLINFKIKMSFDGGSAIINYDLA